MRKNLNDIPCSGAYLYSQSIAMPEIENTDFLFGDAAASAVPEFAAASDPCCCSVHIHHAFPNVSETTLIHAIHGVNRISRLVRESSRTLTNPFKFKRTDYRRRRERLDLKIVRNDLEQYEIALV